MDTRGGTQVHRKSLDVSLRVAVSLLFHLFPILKEGCETFVGQRMAEQLVEHLEGNGSDVRARERSVDDMHGVTNGCGENLCVESVNVVDVDDLAYEFHS